jgi:dolichol-phosphate mannosyltransferase
MYLSLVIPVFNEEEAIRPSFERIMKAIKDSSLSEKNLEIIFINDGSRDNTPGLLNNFKNFSEPKIKIEVIHFSRNFGHSAAVLAGLEASKGELVSIIDADMQDPPEIISDMVNKLNEGYDVVYGQRSVRQGETLFKKLTAWIFYRTINNLASIDIPKDAGDFRVMTREVVTAVLNCHDQNPFIRGLVAWVGYKQLAFPYVREERKLGTTKYPFKKMVKFAWQAISSFSNTPLLLITYLGFGMLFISCFIGIWALRQYYLGEVIPGWTSLLLGFLAGNSITLLMLGIMGLYIGKIIDQVRGRPRYIIKK